MTLSLHLCINKVVEGATSTVNQACREWIQEAVQEHVALSVPPNVDSALAKQSSLLHTRHIVPLRARDNRDAVGIGKTLADNWFHPRQLCKKGGLNAF